VIKAINHQMHQLGATEQWLAECRVWLEAKFSRANVHIT